jgi:hypothetical protein
MKRHSERRGGQSDTGVFTTIRSTSRKYGCKGPQPVYIICAFLRTAGLNGCQVVHLHSQPPNHSRLRQSLSVKASRSLLPPHYAQSLSSRSAIDLVPATSSDNARMESTSHTMPYLPPEIILIIILTPNIDLTSLLRCARVNKCWHSLIYGSNTLRAKLFLPPRSTSGDPIEVKDPRYAAAACVGSPST